MTTAPQEERESNSARPGKPRQRTGTSAQQTTRACYIYYTTFSEELQALPKGR